MRRLFDLPATVGDAARLDTTTRSHLDEALAAAVAEIQEQQTERSGRWFDAEVDKLERWAADRRASLEAELKELDDRLKELRREARQAGTLVKKLDVQRRIRALETRRDEAWKKADAAKADVDKQKDALLDTIADRLQQQTETLELFTIRWHLR